MSVAAAQHMMLEVWRQTRSPVIRRHSVSRPSPAREQPAPPHTSR